MKKSTIALLLLSISGTIGSILAFKSVKYSDMNYFTTQVHCATATKTLTHALTVPILEAGNFRYYTLADNARACNYSKVASDEVQ